MTNEFRPFSGQETLDRVALRAYRASFWLGMVSNAIFFVTLFMTRILIAKASVPPVLNRVSGLLVTGLMVLSALAVAKSLRDVQSERREGARGALLGAALLATIALVGGLAIWVTSPIPPTNFAGPIAHGTGGNIYYNLKYGTYGEIFYALTGLVGLESLIGVGALWSHYRRPRFAQLRPANAWGLEAVAYFTYFLAAVWVVTYVLLYLI